MATAERVCSWCNKHLGYFDIEGEEDIITHGMCDECQLSQYKDAVGKMAQRIEELRDEGNEVLAKRLQKLLETRLQDIIELEKKLYGKEVINEAEDGVSPVALMRLTEINDPDELLKDNNRENITIEKKIDGWKVQVIKNNGKVHIYSRRGDDKTENFPKLVNELDVILSDGTFVEGELAYWEDGKQIVEKVISVAGSKPEKAKEKMEVLKGTFKIHLYDILWHKGKKVADKSFNERRKLLEQVIKSKENIQLTKQYPFKDWQKVIVEAVKEGGEGIVLKLKDT